MVTDTRPVSLMTGIKEDTCIDNMCVLNGSEDSGKHNDGGSLCGDGERQGDS